jgi:hypothetical protein
MSSWAWVDPRVQQVKAAGVRSYLLERGWKLQTYPRPELLVFEGPLDDDGEEIIQVVPSSERMSDFRRRVEELIGALSVLEGRPAVAILEDMLRLSAQDAAGPSDGQNGAQGAVGKPQAERGT